MKSMTIDEIDDGCIPKDIGMNGDGESGHEINDYRYIN
jgi:hypothetical protein